MNFSTNKKLSKLLSILMVLCLMTAMFAGCKKDKDPADDTEPGFSLDMSEETDPPETQTQPAETTEPVVINENMATITAQMKIRSAPNDDSAVTGILNAGDKVEIKTQKELFGKKWGYISEDDGSLNGWIQMEFVVMDYQPEQSEPTDATEPEATDATEPESTGTATNIKGVVTANGLNVRSKPNTDDGKVQGSYNKGDVVTILETKNGWGRTNKGWIKMDFVNTSGTSNNNTESSNTGSNTTDKPNNTTNVSGNGNTTVVAKGIVIAEELNIRASASKNGDRVGSYTYGARVEILEKSNGWGRTNKGWISMSYVYQDGTTGSKTAKGVIAAEGGLYIRSGPGTGYDSVGAYANGDSVSILEQFTYNGTTWGCTNKGWISMKYVNTGDTSSNTGSGTTTTGKIGTVTTDGLRIRSGPGTGFEVLGSYNNGDTVVILDRQTAENIEWGKTSDGWISMNYVSLG